MAKLKVFVTPIGFHDAYVAAPSQKAALAAWGSDANLFARGVASVVTDPKLTKEPLAKPGEVIKRSRGTTAEQLAALPKARKKASVKKDRDEPALPPKPEPPDRVELDAAEESLAHAERRNASEEERLEAQIKDLQGRLARAKREGADELKRLRARTKKAKAAYDRELKACRA